MKYRIDKNEQGSPQWHKARLGRITASKFDKVVTATGKISSQTDAVINMAVAELITGESIPVPITDAMVRGQELEDDAFNLINFSHDLNLNKAGFVQSISPDDKDYFFGFSPDGENFKAGYGCEIKCPLTHTHIGYLAEGGLPKKYKAQVQGSMALSGCERWFFASYHPTLPPVTAWVERDEKFCKQLIEALHYCDEMINEKYEKLKKLVEVA